MLKDPVCLTSAELKWLRSLIDQHKVHTFYVWGKWLRERAFVLRQDRYECQMCKAAGRYRRAEVVHHIRHLKQRPDLALSMYVQAEDGTQQRQLISLCTACHEACHPERLKHRKQKPTFTTPERWD